MLLFCFLIHPGRIYTQLEVPLNKKGRRGGGGGEVQDLKKIDSLGGGERVQSFLLESGGINLKMGGETFLLLYTCKIHIQVFIVLKPDIICTFLIHSGSLQKIMTAFLSAKAKCFIVLKWFQRRKVRTKLKCIALLFFSIFLR